ASHRTPLALQSHTQSDSYDPGEAPHLTSCFFFSHAAAAPEIYTLSLHDALPISTAGRPDAGSASAPTCGSPCARCRPSAAHRRRSEEHTSELQSRSDLVCRLPPEKKNMVTYIVDVDTRKVGFTRVR